MIDWIYTANASTDLRLAALNCNIVSGKAVYSQMFTWGTCNVQQISPTTNLPACFTT